MGEYRRAAEILCVNDRYTRQNLKTPNSTQLSELHTEIESLGLKRRGLEGPLFMGKFPMVQATPIWDNPKRRQTRNQDGEEPKALRISIQSDQWPFNNRLMQKSISRRSASPEENPPGTNRTPCRGKRFRICGNIAASWKIRQGVAKARQALSNLVEAWGISKSC